MNITKRFMDYYQGNNDREQEPPRGGMKRVGYVMINYTGKLVVINLLFILCCIPVITIPAALSALNCYVGKIFRVGYGVELSDFWKEFKCGIRKNVLLGLINGLIAFYAYYLLSLANNFTGSGQRDVVTGIGIGVAVIAILLGSYSFVLTSMLDLPCRHILKNAGILMIIEWKISVLLVLETVFFWGGTSGVCSIFCTAASSDRICIAAAYYLCHALPDREKEDYRTVRKPEGKELLRN